MNFLEKIGLLLFILGTSSGGETFIPLLSLTIIIVGAFMFFLFSEDKK